MKTADELLYAQGHLTAVMQCFRAAKRAKTVTEALEAILDQTDRCPSLDTSDQAAA